MKRSERMGGPHTSRGVGERQVDSAGGVGWGGGETHGFIQKQRGEGSGSG